MVDEKRIEQLEKDLAAFRKDFKDINETLKSIASQKSEEMEKRARHNVRKAKQRAEDLWDEVSDTGAEVYDRARHQMDHTLQTVNRSVRENPLSSIAIVAGISYIIGFLSRK